MNKQILIALTLCILFAGITSANGETSAIIGIGSGSGATTLPITVTNGTNVGTVDVTLTFDPSIVTVTGVTKGDMGSMFANLEKVKDGQVRIGAFHTSVPGISGDFNVAQVTFKSVSSSGSCPLEIVVTTFSDLTPAGNAMAYTVSNGTYTATSGGNGGNGTYPPTPTPTEIPTITPTETPTIAPTPSPTKIPPNGDDIDKDLTALGKIVMAIAALVSAAIVIILRIRKRKQE
jgi:hypothetical protein